MATKDELFAQLADCTRAWNRNDLVPKSQQLRCRQIGRDLNEIGGMALMQEAYYEAKAENPDVHVIQAYWDGIGDWIW